MGCFGRRRARGQPGWISLLLQVEQRYLTILHRYFFLFPSQLHVNVAVDFLLIILRCWYVVNSVVVL